MFKNKKNKKNGSLRNCLLRVPTAYVVLLLAFIFIVVEPTATVEALQQQLVVSNKPSTSTSTSTSPSFSSLSILERNGGIVYRQSVFNSKEFDLIQKEVSKLMNHLHDETSLSVAQNRRGMTLPMNNPIVQMLQDDTNSLTRLVNTMMAAAGKTAVNGGDGWNGKRSAPSSSSSSSSSPNNNNGNNKNNPYIYYSLSTNLPVEIRTYEKFGAGMSWHVDDELYNPSQIEIVFTVDNTSDCTTMWKIQQRKQKQKNYANDCNDSNDFTIQSQDTDPNSVLLIQAGGPLHCVTSLKRGKRTILKCAYRTLDATFRQDMYTQQFDGNGGSGGSTKNKKKQRKNRR